jgi:hypothetical protein
VIEMKRTAADSEISVPAVLEKTEEGAGDEAGTLAADRVDDESAPSPSGLVESAVVDVDWRDASSPDAMPSC